MELGPLAIEALEAVKGLNPTAANLTRAAKDFDAETARWAFEQWELRKRARLKFARAELMLFDRDGLEMASHEGMARFHAIQFPPGERVADLTCGIGADLIALAKDRLAVGFEIDPQRAALARHNLKVHDVHAAIVEEDCLRAEWDFDYAFADPARRSDRRRTLDPDDFQPRLDALVDRMSSLKLGLIKVSPMLQDEVLRRYGKRVDFLSYGWECREAMLRVGSEPIPQEEFWAAKADSGEWLAPLTQDVDSEVAPLAYLFEADPAAIRAHLLPSLAQALGASTLGGSNGYLTAPAFAKDAEASAWVRAYDVASHGHGDLKRIRAELHAKDGFVKVAKLRGVREEPAEWVKRVRTEGKHELILILYPVGKSLRYALVKPA